MTGDLFLSLKEMTFLVYQEVNVTISDSRGKLAPSREYTGWSSKFPSGL